MLTALHSGQWREDAASNTQYPLHTVNAAPRMQSTASAFLYLSGVCVHVRVCVFTCDCTER